jgi:hypothetical protein
MNFDAITDDQKERIVECGIELLAAITDAYGADTGHSTWERMSDAVGEDFRNQVFLAMLAGRTSNVVTLSGPGIRGQGKFIDVIKQIRACGDLGLKDAKDIADAIDAGAPRVLKLALNISRSTALNTFRALGVNVT